MKRATAFFLLFLSLFFSGYFALSANGEERLTDERILRLIKNAPTSQDYPGTSAVYLLMEEIDFVNEDGSGTYEIHMVIKILDKQAIRLGEISIPYDLADSTLDVVLARTIKSDNTVINVAKENIRELAPYSGFPLYNNIRYKQFSMPAMEVGSVIEYKAVNKVFKPKVPGLFYSYWAFPPGLPVMQSNFEVSIPKDMKANYMARNINVEPKIIIEKQRTTYKWTAKNIFIEGVFEAFLPPYGLVCPNVTFATAKSWDELAKWFYSISEPQLEPDEEMKKFVANVMKRKGNDRERIINELYDYVSRKIRYVAIPLKSSSYKPHKVVDIYTNKYGDCKDKSALLISFCRIAGIDAFFGLLRNKVSGPLVKDFPALDFNHCIVVLPKPEGGYMLLDTTLELSRYGYLPTTLQEVEVFVVKKDGYEFIKLPYEREDMSGTKSEVNMEIDEDYIIHVDDKVIYFGDMEISSRLNAKYSTRDAVRAYLERIMYSKYTKGRLIDIDFPNPENLEEKFWLKCEYELKEHIKEAGNLLIFDLPAHMSSVAVSKEERIHPLWFPGLFKDESILNITIPAACKIKFLPSNIKNDTSFGYYKREVSSRGNKITIRQHYEIKMLEIPVKQYKEYKKFIESIVKATRESIILEKTK